MYCLLVISNLALSQSKQLPVRHISQEGDYLCWAASMEMIFKYHNPSSPYDQCKIVEMMQGHGVTCAPCLDMCSPTIIQQSIADLQLNAERQSNPNCNFIVQTPRIKKILQDSFKYHLTYYTNPNWLTVQKNINSNRPMMGFEGNPIETCSASHVVIIIGYTVETGNQFYLVNDPIDICNSQGVQKIAFSRYPNIITVCSYLGNLYPNLVPYALIVSTNKDSPKDSSSVNQKDELKWEGQITQELTPKELTAIINSGHYSSVEKVYYSTENHKYFSTIELTYLDGKAPYTRTTLQKLEDKWLPVIIERTNDDYYKMLKPNQEDEDIILSKRPDKVTTALQIKPYKKVVLLPINKTFYVFYHNKEPLFLPIINEFDKRNKPLNRKDMERFYKVDASLIHVLNKNIFNFKSFNKLNSF